MLRSNCMRLACCNAALHPACSRNPIMFDMAFPVVVWCGRSRHPGRWSILTHCTNFAPCKCRSWLSANPNASHKRRGRHIGSSILHPNGIDRQRSERGVDQCTQDFGPVATCTCRGQQHHASLDGSRARRDSADRAQVDAASTVTGNNRKKLRTGALACRSNGCVQTFGCLRREQQSTDMPHGFGVAIQFPEHSQITHRQRSQAQARCGDYWRDHAPVRLSVSSRRSIVMSGSSLRAGGITRVSAGSMCAITTLPSVARSMRGAKIGKVAAR